MAEFDKLENNSCPFTVEYQNSKHGNDEIYEITWSFPKYRKLLNSTAFREFRTTRDKPASKIQLKMLLWGEGNELVEIFYYSPTSLYLSLEIELITNQAPSLGPLKHNPLFIPNGASHNIPQFDFSLGPSPAQNQKSNKLTVQSRKIYFKTIQSQMWHNILNIQKSQLSDSDYYIKFKYIVPVPNDALEVNRTSNILKHADLELIKDLKNMLGDEIFADATLISTEGKEFKAHISILVARSDVLKAHFKHGTVIHETGFESDVLEEMIFFIYTARAPRIDEFPEKLLHAADFYQLNELKELCGEALQKTMTVENAIDTLQQAEQYSAKSLKQSTLQFIQDGRSNLIIETEAWKNLQNIKLVKEIYESYVTGKVQQRLQL